MTQSKKDEDTIIVSSLSGDDIVIDLSGEVNAAQTMYTGTNDSTFVISDGINGVTTYNTDWVDSSGISSITLDNSSYTISIGNDTINLDNFYKNLEKKVFENTMPDITQLEKMCKEYPGLEKAYETFKTIYKMVEQDYNGKKKSGELDDDIPF